MRPDGERQTVKGSWMRPVLCVHSVLLLFILATGCAPPAGAAGWQGVDETVVEKIAAEHGRPPQPPVIDTDKGDLLLFLFLLAGGAAGFAAGYYWRMLTEQKRQDRD